MKFELYGLRDVTIKSNTETGICDGYELALVQDGKHGLLMNNAVPDSCEPFRRYE